MTDQRGRESQAQGVRLTLKLLARLLKERPRNPRSAIITDADLEFGPGPLLGRVSDGLLVALGRAVIRDGEDVGLGHIVEFQRGEGAGQRARHEDQIVALAEEAGDGGSRAGAGAGDEGCGAGHGVS